MKLASFLSATVFGSLCLAGASSALPSDLLPRDVQASVSPIFARGPASIYERADSQTATDIITALNDARNLSVTLDKTIKGITKANAGQEGGKIAPQIQEVSQRLMKETNALQSAQPLSDSDASSVVAAFTSFVKTHTTTIDDLVEKAPVINAFRSVYGLPINAALEQNEKAFDAFTLRVMDLVSSAQRRTMQVSAADLQDAYDKALIAYPGPSKGLGLR